MSWRGWFFRRREEDLEEEINTHLSMAARDLAERGGTPEQAAIEARREFGNVTLVKEVTRDVWGWRALETLGQDASYAYRSLRATPVFALVAIASLSLGIGANTAVFSFFDAILLKRLPVPEPQQLVQIARYENGKQVQTFFSYPFLTRLDQESEAFTGVLGRFPVRVSLTANDSAEPLNGEVVTGSYFKTLQVKAVLGRLITEQDVDAAGNPVCVISYALWQNRFNGDPGIIGRKLMLNARPYTVIGITEKGFYGPQLESRIDMQLPVSRMGDFMQGFFESGPDGPMWKSSHFIWLQPLARLKPGVSLERAQAMTDRIAASLALQLPGPQHVARTPGAKTSFRLSDGSQGTNSTSSYARPLTVLMAVAALVLLIACANLASLLLARANARAKESAVRLSLGAGRFRLVRQFMTESLGLACCGGLAGIGLAYWIIRTLLAFVNAGRTHGGGTQASLDPRALGFAVALSLATAFLFGLVPALQASRPDVLPELKGVPGGSGSGPTGFEMRRFLIVFQIALATVIVFTAGLLTRTLARLQTVDLGFRPERVLSMGIDPQMNGYSPTQADRIFEEVLTRLRAQPNIAGASLAVISPLGGSAISLSVDVPGHVAASSDAEVKFNIVSPGYFETLNQPLLSGRDFTERDSKQARRVAIVNKRFLAQYMPGLDSIGRHFEVEGMDTEIVGVTGNSKYESLREGTGPIVYVPATQMQSSGYTLLVRTRVPPHKAVADIEDTIRSVAPHVPIFDVREMQEQINSGISAERVLSFLSALFSGLATLLCGIGIYGLIAYAVSRRTREIGVRFAIGARKTDVARLFLGQSAMLVGLGILLGIPLALVSTRVLKSLLYGVTASDGVTLACTILVFVLAGMVASIIPVLKAAQIEPLQALRYE